MNQVRSRLYSGTNVCGYLIVGWQVSQTGRRNVVVRQYGTDVANCLAVLQG